MAGDENEKITIAVLSQQILTLTAEAVAIRAELRSLNSAITEYRVLQSRHDTQIQNLGSDYDSLSSRVNGWSSLNSAGVVTAAILGMIFGNRNP